MHTKLMSIVLAVFMTVAPAMSEVRDGHEVREIPPPRTLSSGMATEAQTALLNLHQHLKSGAVTAKDVSRASEAMRMTFANWDETGFTSQIETYLLANEQKFVDGPTADEIHTGYLRNKVQFEATGITEAEFTQSFISVSRMDRIQFMQELKSSGLKALNQRILRHMDSFSDKIAQGRNPMFRDAGALGWIGLYLGVASLAIVSAPEIAVGLAVGGIVCGMIDMISDGQ